MAQGGRGVIVPGCPACKKLLQTIPHFLDHLTEDILPKVIVTSRLRTIHEVGAKVDSRVPATGTNTLHPAKWDFRFRRIEVARHSNIANLGMLKFSLAVRTLKNPFRHVAAA
jgi:hypothetical protein